MKRKYLEHGAGVVFGYLGTRKRSKVDKSTNTTSPKDIKMHTRSGVHSRRGSNRKGTTGKKRTVKKSTKLRLAGVGAIVKQEKKQIEGDDIHSGLSGKYISVKIGGRGRKSYGKYRGGPLKAVSITGKTVNYVSGGQSCDYLKINGVASDWLTTVNNNDDYTYGGWFSYDPYMLATGSKDSAGNVVIPAANYSTGCMEHVKDVTRLMLTNTTNIGQYHRVYVIECIRNTNQGPLTMWSDGLVREGMGKGTIVLPGAGGSGGSSAGYLTPSIVHCYPNESREFKRYFKIRKVTKVYLAAGATEELIFDIKVGQKQQREYVQKAYDGGVEWLKGSYCIFNVCYGTAVIDETAGGTNQPTYGAVEYAAVTNTTTHLRAVEQKRKNAVLLGYAQIPSNTANADAKIINMQDVVDSLKKVL